MNDKPSRGTADEQPVSGAKDERVRDAKAGQRRSGVHGPVAKDRAGYQTHYGETAYGGGQKRYSGQSPVEDLSKGDDGRAEGRAGSRATVPGAGADHGPPQSR